MAKIKLLSNGWNVVQRVIKSLLLEKEKVTQTAFVLFYFFSNWLINAFTLL